MVASLVTQFGLRGCERFYYPWPSSLRSGSLCQPDEGKWTAVSLDPYYRFGSVVCTTSRYECLLSKIPWFIFILRQFPIPQYQLHHRLPITKALLPLRRTYTLVMSHSPELHVKVLMIGNSSVGKSSLLMRWSENQWLPEDEADATIGVEVKVGALLTPIETFTISDRTFRDENST